VPGQRRLTALVVLDTDAASLLQKGRLPADLAPRLTGATLAVSFVTVGELYNWAERRAWGQRTRDKLEAWLHSLFIISAPQTWRSDADVRELFRGDADLEWVADRDRVDQALRDPLTVST